MKPNTEETDCLIRCHGEHCSSSQCCSRENFLEDACKSTKDAHIISRKYDKKEIIPAACAVNLEKFTIYEEETLKRTASDPKTEKSAHVQTNENACRSNDEQIQSIINVNAETSSCAISLANRISINDDYTSATTDSTLDHSIIS